MEKNDLLAALGPTADKMDYVTNFIEWSIAVVGPTASQIDFTDLTVNCDLNLKYIPVLF